MDPALYLLMRQGQSQDEVPAILRLAQPGIVPPGVRIVTLFGDIATVRLPRGLLSEVRDSALVISAKGYGLLQLDDESELMPSTETSEEILPFR